MDLDAKVCYCFHVSRRKLVNFVRLYRPRVPSQLSECGGAGTGWARPGIWVAGACYVGAALLWFIPDRRIETAITAFPAEEEEE